MSIEEIRCVTVRRNPGAMQQKVVDLIGKDMFLKGYALCTKRRGKTHRVREVRQEHSVCVCESLFSAHPRVDPSSYQGSH